MENPCGENSVEVEIWKPVPGIDGYEASNFGRVRSWRNKTGKPRTLKPNLHSGRSGDGYFYVRYRENGKRMAVAVHVMVAAAFIGEKPSQSSQVRHLDGNSLNNRSYNLKWGTPKENGQDKIAHGTSRRGEASPASKLKLNDVVFIKNLLNAKALPNKKIAKIYGISTPVISLIKTNRVWAHVWPTKIFSPALVQAWFAYHNINHPGWLEKACEPIT